MNNLSNPLYPLLPSLLPAIDRLLPDRWRKWPAPFGGRPPQSVIDRFPRYDAVALAHRMRTKVLQETAFHVTAQSLERYVADNLIVDIGLLRSWLHGGKGAIFASPHYGPFLGAALLFAAEGTIEHPSHVFYDPADAVPENLRFDTFFGRFDGKLNVLHNQAPDLIKAGRALRNKQCISIMFDVVQRAVDCMYVPFFDRLYPAMGGAAYLSLLSKAPVIPTYTVPEAGHKVRIVFGEPLLPENFSGPEREQNVFAMTSALFRDLQRQLSEAPWHWIYWNYVSQTSPFSAAMVRDDVAMLEEIRQRVRATPQLLKVAPTLASLLEAP